jgi:hypothetical protein
MARRTQDTTEVSEPVETGIALRGPQYDSNALRAIESFDDAIALTQVEMGEIVAADQVIGDGFAIVTDKDSLIGKPLLFMSWTFHSGDYGTFVSAQCAARNESGGVSKVILNDGSTGVFQQLSDYTNSTDKMGGLLARHGLRRSDYTYTGDDGKEKPASTYYIDTSA